MCNCLMKVFSSPIKSHRTKFFNDENVKNIWIKVSPLLNKDDCFPNGVYNNYKRKCFKEAAIGIRSYGLEVPTFWE